MNGDGFISLEKVKTSHLRINCLTLLSKQEKEEIFRFFRGLDENRDGKLKKDEIKACYVEFFGGHLSDRKLEDAKTFKFSHILDLKLFFITFQAVTIFKVPVYAE